MFSIISAKDARTIYFGDEYKNTYEVELKLIEEYIIEAAKAHKTKCQIPRTFNDKIINKLRSLGYNVQMSFGCVDDITCISWKN